MTIPNLGPKKTTPPSHDENQDPNKKGHDHNYFLWQTRSGHIPLRVDDTKGNESISMEHRTGSKISFLADGSTKFVSNYGRVDITYGQHRSVTTGAHDSTHRGDSSTRTEGTRRETNEKDYEQSTAGKHVSTADSYSMSAKEGFHVAAKDLTIKADSGTIETGKGPIALTGKGTVSMISQGSSVGIGSETGSVGVKAKLDVSTEGREVHISSTGGARIVFKGNEVHINGISAVKPEELQPWNGVT